MKKSKKLLSVLLAVLMLLSSMSVMASAAKAEYKTTQALKDAQAYSTYGAVTRLSTEERLSIVFDYLDGVLGSLPNSSMSVAVIGDIKYGSVNELLGTLDSVTSNGAIKAAIGFAKVNPNNTLGKLVFDNWQSGMTREGTDHTQIVQQLLKFLNDNAPAIQKIINDGALNLGLIGTILKSFVDLNTINNAIANLPGMIRGFIYPLFERKDDNQAQIATLAKVNGNYGDSGVGKVADVLNDFVKGLFTKPQSTTTYKEDAEGNCISGHKLPTQDQNLRYYYEKSGDSITCYVWNTETGAYEAEEEVFHKTEESEGVYTYNKSTGEGLKYYKEGSYWLPSLQKDDSTGTKVDLTTNSAASLLYNLIPYVFKEMAPVVLNGSVKKLLGGVLGVKYTYVGEVGSEEVKALPDASDAFFTEEQGDYLWEWSNYAVIGGNHYYRFEDQIFRGDTSNTVPFFKIINWDYKITDDFIDEFVPGADGSTKSTKGYTTLLQGLNDFLVKAAKELLEDNFEATIGLEPGDNTHLINNVKKAAQTVLKYSPETIFGAEYADPDKYYSLVTSEDDQEVLIGIACTVIDLLMPQMILPKADALKGKDYKVGAILAAVLRELATQLLPTHNYDALIYSDYNTKTLLTGKDNSYWLDVLLTMGTDIGVYYLKNLADMGEDTDAWKGMKWEDSKTYKASDLNEIDGVKPWEAKVDYIIDWALTTNQEWAWKFSNLVNYGETTIDMATVQDPWVKLGNILKNLLPVKEIFNLDIDGNDHWLETLLRDNFVLAIADLDLTKIAGGATANGVLNIPTSSILRKENVLVQITVVIRDLLNNILYKVAGNQNLIDPGVFTELDTLFRRQNLATLVNSLLTKLLTAYNNGLLDTAMPFVNFFVGWTTDAQKMADPTVTIQNTNGYPYMFSEDSTTVKSTLSILNASSGMLLTHRESSVEDKAYDMYVTAVTSEYGEVTVEGQDLSSTPIKIEPGAIAKLPISMPYDGDKATSITISYYYAFKGGQTVGDGTAINRVTYEYVSNAHPQTEEVNTYDTKTVQVKNTALSRVNAISIKPQDVPKYVEVTNLANLSSLGYGFENVNDQNYSVWIKEFSPSGNPAYVKVDTSEFVHGAAENADMKDSSHGWMDGDNKNANISPYKLDTDADISSVTSGSVIDLGTFSVTWHNTKSDGNFGVGNNGDQNVTFDIDAGDVYYKDTSKLEEVFEQYAGVQRKNYSKDADAEWATFHNAMLAAEALLGKPFNTETFASDYSAANLEKTVKAITDAYKALSKKEATSTSDVLESALAEVEPGGDVPEINYQDYKLYEYFEYQDYRTAVRNRIKEYNGPEKPEKYIPDSSLWGDTTVDEFLTSVENEKKKEAITATVIQPTEAENQAYQAALAEWRAPTYSELDNDNQSQLLKYYKQFLLKKTVDKQFLDKEIQYANAQSYSQQDYSKDSWAAYQEAYNNAVTVNSKGDALQSEVFDAKYALMKAENELLAADKSMKDGNTLDNLNALIEKAEDIFQNPANYKVKGETDETEAYKQLIEALGYKTESGEILYDHSALTFVEYDRETTQNNLDRLANAEAKLQAAIDNFEANVVADIFPKEEGTEGQDHNGVVDTDRNDGVHTGGYLYGITPGEEVEEVFGSHATLNVVANDKGVKNATGAVVQVKSGEQVVAEYVVIIFGDVNGDGEVDSTDSFALMQGVSGDAELAGAFDFAGDLNADGSDDSTDSFMVMQYVSGDNAITTNPYKES